MIRSTFMGYETSKSALNYAQKAIDIVGNNISNGSSTTGYTRQRVEVASNYVSTTTGRFSDDRTPLAGQGVTTLGVSQTRDVYLDANYRNQLSIASGYSTASTLLTDIQTALGTGSNVTDTSDILGAIQNVYESIYDYTSDSTTDAQANVVYTAFQKLVTTINTASGALQSAKQDAISTTQTGVDRVNTILSKVGDINKQMAKEAAANSGSSSYFYDNELMDQRNTLLDELSSYGNIKVSEYDDGTCDVSFAGVSAVTSSGDSQKLNLQENSDGTIAVKWLSDGTDLKASSGSLLSDIQYINGRGSNIQSNTETPEQGFLYYQDRLNTLAAAVVQVANSSIPEVDTDGNPKTDTSGNTVYKTLLGATQSDGSVTDTGTITADNIAISDDWSNGGAGYFIYNKDEADYSYALALSNKLTGQDNTFSSYGESFTGTFEEYVNDYVTTLGSSITTQSGLSKTAASVADDYQDAKDDVEAVNQDEETTNMLTFQRIYQAAARVMTTMDDLLDVVINKMAV